MKQYIFNFDTGELKLNIVVQPNPSNGHLLLGLQHVESEELFDEITAEISPLGFQGLNSDEIIIKAYGHQGNLHQWLVDNNIATCTGEYITKRCDKIPLMKLTPEFIEENKNAIAAASME